MNSKKVMALFLTAAMSVSLLAGCGSSDNGGASADSKQEESKVAAVSGEEEGAEENGTDEISFPLTETVKFTALAGMNGDYTISDNPAMKKALGDANIEVEWIDVLGADLEEKRNLILASGEYPDFFYKSYIDSGKYGQQGILIPLEDLIREYAPNLTALLDERDGWQYITAADGHVYGLPEVDNQGPANPSYWINQEWMDNLGLQEPTSFDELYEVLKAFKEQDANGNGDPDDEIPMLCDSYCNPLMLMQYCDFPYSAWEKLGIIDGELTYVPVHEKFKEFLAYAAKLYQEGLIYEHCFTTSHDQVAAIGQSGDILGAFFDAGAFLTVGRDRDDAYIALTPWDDCLQLGSGITGSTFAITDKCENPEILVAWMDYFYTQEGGQLAWLGVEGETWQYNDKGEWEWILGNGYGDDVSTVRASATLQGAQNHPSVQPDIWTSSMSADIDPDEVYLLQQNRKVAEHGVVPLPNMVYTEEQNSAISTIKTDIDSYINQYMAQVITGEVSLEDSWDSYLDTMEAMGASRMMAIYQEVYEAAK